MNLSNPLLKLPLLDPMCSVWGDMKDLSVMSQICKALLDASSSEHGLVIQHLGSNQSEILGIAKCGAHHWSCLWERKEDFKIYKLDANKTRLSGSSYHLTWGGYNLYKNHHYFSWLVLNICGKNNSCPLLWTPPVMCSRYNWYRPAHRASCPN